MRRVMKIEGYTPNGNVPPVWYLPDGEYKIKADDGETIALTVRHGPAGVGVVVHAQQDLTADVYQTAMRVSVTSPSGTRIDTRCVDVTYHSPFDAYAQYFKAWYSAPVDARPPYFSREEFDAQNVKS